MNTRMTTIKLTDAIIRATANEKSFTRGQQLYRSGAIADAAIQANVLTGRCEGTQSPFYKVRAELDGGGIRAASCGCKYNFGGYCKHIVALLLTFANKPNQFVVRKDLTAQLSELNRERLLELFTELLAEAPELGDWLEAAIATPATAQTSNASTVKNAAPKRKKEIDTEPYRRRVRGIMHSLDRMRASDAYWQVGGLANELCGVEKTAMEFLEAGDAEAALRILMTIVEESHSGFNYIDDSYGELGDYFDGLGRTLAEVILSLDLDAEGRADILSDLDEYHRSLSDYGVDGLQVAMAAAEHGWGKIPGVERSRSIADDWDEDDEDDGDREEDGNVFTTSGAVVFGYYGRQSVEQLLTGAKLNVLERQGRTEEYLALCLKTGSHLPYVQKLAALGRVAETVTYAQKRFELTSDALQLARQLREAGKLDEALKVGEHGLKLGGSKASLGEWLGPMEEAQGRMAQALEAWQAAFRDSPSLASWQTVKRLAGTRWKRLKPELMASLEKHYSRQPLAEVLLDEQEWDQAAAVADKEKNDYRLVAIVAEALIVHRPEWVIRASIKQSDALIEKTQSKHYLHAADWLRRAKEAYAELGQSDKWRQYLYKLKEQYKRRPALMAHLERL
ncbi:MAG TPA: SWIM zinc finger family protein [Blastocatellia bacterium]|jgi:uncharacterized Zn finger protein